MTHAIDNLIINFQHFLNTSWPNIDAILDRVDWDDDCYWLDDWIEANWKIMVERLYCSDSQQLQSYGYEQNKQKHSHVLLCYTIQEPNKRFVFQSLTGKKQDSATLAAPFDWLIAFDPQTKSQQLLKFSDVKFIVESNQ